jgi:hypothetical protein
LGRPKWRGRNARRGRGVGGHHENPEKRSASARAGATSTAQIDENLREMLILNCHTGARSEKPASSTAC